MRLFFKGWGLRVVVFLPFVASLAMELLALARLDAGHIESSFGRRAALGVALAALHGASAMVRRRKPRGIHAAADALDVDKLRRILAAGTDPNESSRKASIVA